MGDNSEKCSKILLFQSGVIYMTVTLNTCFSTDLLCKTKTNSSCEVLLALWLFITFQNLSRGALGIVLPDRQLMRSCLRCPKSLRKAFGCQRFRSRCRAEFEINTGCPRDQWSWKSLKKIICQNEFGPFETVLHPIFFLNGLLFRNWHLLYWLEYNRNNVSYPILAGKVGSIRCRSLPSHSHLWGTLGYLDTVLEMMATDGGGWSSTSRTSPASWVSIATSSSSLSENETRKKTIFTWTQETKIYSV